MPESAEDLKGTNLSEWIEKWYGNPDHFKESRDPTGKKRTVLTTQGTSTLASIIEGIGGEAGFGGFREVPEGAPEEKKNSVEIAETLGEKEVSYAYVKLLFEAMQLKSPGLLKSLYTNFSTRIGNIGYYEQAFKLQEDPPYSLEPDKVDLNLAVLYLGFIGFTGEDGGSSSVKNSMAILKRSVPDEKRALLEGEFRRFDAAVLYARRDRPNPLNIMSFISQENHFKRLMALRQFLPANLESNERISKLDIDHKSLSAIVNRYNRGLVNEEEIEEEHGAGTRLIVTQWAILYKDNTKQSVVAADSLLKSANRVADDEVIRAAAQYLKLFGYLPEQLKTPDYERHPANPFRGVHVYNGIRLIDLLDDKHYNFITKTLAGIRKAILGDLNQSEDDSAEVIQKRAVAAMAGQFLVQGLSKPYFYEGKVIPSPCLYLDLTDILSGAYTRVVSTLKRSILPPEKPEEPQESDYEGRADEFEAAQQDYQTRMTRYEKDLESHRSAERKLITPLGYRAGITLGIINPRKAKR